MDQREMLEEYFSLVISEGGTVESLPMLLKNYTPNLDRLPLFLMRLGPQVCTTFCSIDVLSFIPSLSLL